MEDNKMEKIEYLPLGSVVLLEGGIKKLIIVGRGLTVKMGEKANFFDYAGAQFPEGIMGDQLGYFNHNGIAKVIFKGYSDDDDKIIVENINRYISSETIENGKLTEGAKAGVSGGT